MGPVLVTQAAAAQEICDPVVDPACVEYDTSTCDWLIDPACDPAYCDPTYDLGCDPSYCDPIYDLACDPFSLDPAHGPGTTDVPYCDPMVDLSCDSTPWTTAPPALAFAQSSPLVDAVLTRSDTSDDVLVERIPDEEVAVVAASRLALGIDALAEIGAFERMVDPETSDLLREIRNKIPADGLTADGYRSEVERLAEDLPRLIEQLESGGFEVSDEVVDVVDALDDTVGDIIAGETSLLDGGPWLSALADLAVRGGAAPLDPSDREDDFTAVLGVALLFAQPDEVPDAPAEVEVVAEAATTTAAPTTTLPSTPTRVAPSAAAIDEPNGTSAVLLVGGAIAGLLALVAFLLIRRRSTADAVVANAVAEAADHKLSVNDLLDASRRMTASLDIDEICAIAIAETERLVDSEGGLVAVRAPSGLMPAYATPGELFRLKAIERSSLVRVTETGQSVSTVATEEAVLVEVPMAMAAVPIVADGTITGAIMVVRVSSNPFARADLEALEMLAPLVGSAFLAAQAHGSATELADVEPMTGLKNRRRLDKDLASSDGDLVAYIMLDVDHFKNFNDVNGHAAGDEALRRVASTLSASVRPGDVVYRYGGEEFCVLLPNTTATEAREVAERIRAGVETCEIPGEEHQPSGTVTVSIGVADTSSQPVSDLIERADAALYQAKHGGRNRVQLDS